ncbi:flagellar basal body rod protein FlgC [candidate division KSB1 bacterium]|nr:flagellar basal body rod protein FlgC [candidate division KSB1 bacterium]
MGIRKILSAFDISALGMRAQRKRMDAISSNLANIETTRTEKGEPYRRKIVKMETAKNTGTFQQVLFRTHQKLAVTNPKHIRTSHINLSGANTGNIVDAQVVEVQENAFRTVYDPDHPDADVEGYIQFPNINLVTEMVDMIVASRTYEANATALEANKAMAKKALEI